ncbi:MAG: T9SS type A sorting domain-containing protein [Bacteroidetes bacterium]|nr:T9SS type A sorting domain-containing protein [Bacteroidota bacterium]
MKNLILLCAFLTLAFTTQGQAPVNDICADAIDLIPNTGYQTFSNANTVTNAANPTCGGGTQIKDVWFSFDYTGGNITINTQLSGTLTDTRLAVYSACDGTQLACNDDFNGSYSSQISLTCTQLTAGNTYYIQAGGYNGLSGTFGIQIISTEVEGCMNPLATNYNACATVDNGTCVFPNANDECSTAVPLTPNGGSQNVTNVNSTVGPTPGCGGGIRDIWFSFVYTGGNISITTSASSSTTGTQLVDTQLAVYDACGGNIIACDDDDAPGNYSMIRFGCPTGNGTAGAFEDDALIYGHTYYIQAGGYNNTQGIFAITLTNTIVSGCTDENASNYSYCATVDNGTCEFPPIFADFNYNVLANASNCLTYQLNNTSLGNQSAWLWNIPNAIISDPTAENPTVVFSAPGIYSAELMVTDVMGNTNTITQNIIVTAPHTLTIDMTADNLPQQTSWKVFNGQNLLIAQGTTNDASLCISDECHRVEFFDTGNNGICCNNGNGSYSIYLDGNLIANGGAFGNYTFVEINCPQGSTCEDPIVATLDTLDVPLPSTWYSFTPSVNGQYKISTCGLASCNTTIWIYDYCNMANFDESNQATYTYNDDFCGLQSEITPYLEAGVTYYVRVGDHNNDCGVASYQVLFDYMGPIQGCMDEMACNYSPLAEMPDICYYNGDPNCSNIGPDLSVDGNLLFNSTYQTTLNGTDACLVSEGCLQGLGTREIVRFSTRIDNVGNQDYFIGVPSANNEQFVWDLCHNHYHYAGYAEYELYDDAGNLMPEVGFKNGFCVLDLGCVTGIAKFGCGNMGITVGCYDIYSSALQCQWVDVTDVPAGTYHLVLKTNWDHDPDMLGHYELAYDNNWAQVCFSFERDSLDQLINFVKLPMSACGVLTDCLGQPFGSSQPDCLGNCPGQVKKGDLNSDLMFDLGDIHAYGNGSVNETLAATNCNDLNQDGTVSIADAAYLDQCIHSQQDQGILPGLMLPCAWDAEIVDITETSVLGIANLNTTDGYFDVTITNPDGPVNALQFTISGATIMSIESLLPSTTWSSHLYFQDEGTQIAALGHLGTMIPTNFSPLPVIRVHYANITSDNICIENIEDVINVFMHNTLTQIGSCVDVTTMVTSAQFEEATCVNQSITFTDNSIGNTSRIWYFPGGNPSTSTASSVDVTYATPGTYGFALVVSDGQFSDSTFFADAITVDNSLTYYLDFDGDGFGSNTAIEGCSAPTGYVLDASDCDDDNANIYPGNFESCNQTDDNCNTQVDETFDLDNDGFTSCNGDCDDNNLLANPNAIELCNNQDDNCNSIIDEGFDIDGDGFTSCNGDCDDNNPMLNPTIAEACNGLDDNCNGLADEGLSTPWYNDIDQDGYGAGIASYFCIHPVGMVSNAADCDDSNPLLNPAAVEILDNIDNDCDGFIDEGTVEVNYNLEEAALQLFPNPAHDQVSILLGTYVGTVQVQVIDLQGKKVAEYQFTGQRLDMDISPWASGVYHFVLTAPNAYGALRLIKE